MTNIKWICILIIVQFVMMENKGKTQKVSTFKLVDHNSLLLESDNSVDSFEYIDANVVKCKNEGTDSSSPHSWYNGRTMSSFIDFGTNASESDKEMEAPNAKFSILNLLSFEEDKEDDNDDYSNNEEKDEEEKEKDEIIFFDDDEEEEEEEEGETDSNKLTDGYLKQYHRQRLRMHNFVFPLLLAYKLKFFTVIPLLLGALVLLVGTTGVAGFFFALFAAALGIHVKSHES